MMKIGGTEEKEEVTSPVKEATSEGYVKSSAAD